MTPFFETELQGIGFLFLCALGFGLSIFFDGVSRIFKGRFKPVGDILLLLTCGIAMLVTLLFLRPGELRPYHWLAMLTGAILYLCGIRRLIVFVIIRIKELLKHSKTKRNL